MLKFLISITVVASSLIQLPITKMAVGETEEDPIIITTATELVQLASDVNAGDTKENLYYRLDNDIDLDGIDFIPIGKDAANSFKGTFDGADHVISNLEVDRGSSNYVGLFGYIFNGRVENLEINAPIIYGKQFVGGLVGYLNNGSIYNVRVINNADIAGRSDVGGIAGRVNVSTLGIDYCEFVGSVYGYSDSTASAFDSIGGITGYLASSSLTRNEVAATITGRNDIGGIVGHISGSASKSTVANNFTRASSVYGIDRVGGIVGDINSSNTTDTVIVNNNYALGYVVGDTNVGGIAGYLYGGYLLDNAALNQSVVAKLSGPGKVLGGYKTDYKGEISNNLSYSRMYYQYSTSIGLPYNSDIKLNGSNISSTEILTDGTIRGKFIAPIWTVENGLLPDFDEAREITSDTYLEPQQLNSFDFETIGDITYTGTELQPSVKAKSPIITYEVVEYTNNINVGTASIKVRGTEDYSGEVILNFNITKAEPFFNSPNQLEAIYGQTLNDMTLPANFGFVDALTTSVGDVGENEFEILYSPTDTLNYESVTDTISILVSKQSVPLPKIIPNLIFNSSSQSGVAYDTTSTLYTPSGDLSGIDKGSYVAIFTLNYPSNYTWADDGNPNTDESGAAISLTWTIGQNSNGSATISKDSFVYDKSIGAEPIISDKTGDWEKTTFEYSEVYDFATILSSAPTDAGSYYVRAILSESPDSDYGDFITLPADYTIERKSLTTSETRPLSTYAYTSYEIRPAATLQGLTVGIDYEVSYENNINVGTGTVNMTGVNNYKDTISTTFTIAKATIHVTPTNTEKTYGEADSALSYTYTGLLGDDTLTGTIGRDSGDNAGTYHYNTGTLSNDNYNIIVDEEATFTINKANQNAPAVEVESTSGTKIVIKAVENALYRIDNGEWQESNVFDGLIAERSYNISVRLIGDANHFESAVTTLQVTTPGAAPTQSNIWWLYLLIGILIGILVGYAIFFGIIKKNRTEEQQ